MKAARAFFKRPWIIIAICVILTGVFGFFITGLGIDNSIRQFLPQKDASYTRLTQTENEFDFSQYDYVVDAIDTVVGKLSLIEKAKAAGVPIICAMGAGNKMDPTKFEVADISETSVCPLARVIRTELRKRKISGVKVVYSKEIPIKPKEDTAISCKYHCVCPPGTVRKCTAKHQIPGSNAFVPPVVGLIIAGEVIKDLTGYNK